MLVAGARWRLKETIKEQGARVLEDVGDRGRRSAASSVPGGTVTVSLDPPQLGCYPGAAMRPPAIVAVVASASVLLAGGASAFGIELEPPPPPGVVGTPYKFVFLPQDGAPPYAFWHDAGDLPPGLKIEPDGTMQGTPTAAGTFIFVVGASQCCGQDSQWGFSVTIRDRLTITTGSLPSASPGSPYTATIGVIGHGGKGMGWSIASGSLPPGLALAKDGTPYDTLLSGTPSASGSYTFTVKVDDTDGFMPSRAVTKQFTITVGAQLSAASAATLPTGIQGKLYSATPATASGGLPPFTWSIVTGALPPGVTLDPATGAVSGRPTAFGTFSFTLGVRDASGQTATADATIAIVRALDLRTTRLRPASVGDAVLREAPRRGRAAPGFLRNHRRQARARLEVEQEDRRRQRDAEGRRHVPLPRHRSDALGQRSSERITLVVHAS